MIYIGENYVAVPAGEFEKVKSSLSIFYGVDVVGQGDYVYLFPKQKSGVRQEYKEAVKQLLMQEGFDEMAAKALAEHNPLPLTVLATVLAVVATLAYFYREEIKEQLGGLGEYFWKVFLPIFTFGFGAWIAYNALRR